MQSCDLSIGTEIAYRVVRPLGFRLAQLRRRWSESGGQAGDIRLMHGGTKARESV
jgi:hypothetical protein